MPKIRLKNPVKMPVIKHLIFLKKDMKKQKKLRIKGKPCSPKKSGLQRTVKLFLTMKICKQSLRLRRKKIKRKQTIKSRFPQERILICKYSLKLCPTGTSMGHSFIANCFGFLLIFQEISPAKKQEVLQLCSLLHFWSQYNQRQFGWLSVP